MLALGIHHMDREFASDPEKWSRPDPKALGVLEELADSRVDAMQPKVGCSHSIQKHPGP
jgi:hypothetical protein